MGGGGGLETWYITGGEGKGGVGEHDMLKGMKGKGGGGLRTWYIKGSVCVCGGGGVFENMTY